jgi:hypothetical protein
MNYLAATVVAAALACAPTGAIPLAAQAAAPAPQQEGGRWTWHGRLAAGKTLQIRGVNGSIVAEPASGDEVVVTAEKHGRRSDPDEVRIEVVQDADGVTICAVYPGSRNRCGPGDDYHMRTHNNDVEVEFHAQVPAGVAFEGGNVNGDVEVNNLGGPVRASTVNGGVRMETSAGEASGSTVNGGITAVVHGQGREALRFRTVNGSVTVTLPKDLNADLEAATVNGSITTDFPVTVMGRLSRRRLEGRIGQGGRVLHLASVNGSIRIRALP